MKPPALTIPHLLLYTVTANGFGVGANLLFSLIAAPLYKNQIGTGISRTAIQPSRVEAYSIPIPLNICCAKRGNTAPQRERRKVFAAIAEAANCMSVSRMLR
jgi:hypothetical protein